MTGRVIRFPIADALGTALVAATELDRDQLEQLQEHVRALLAALPPPPAAVVEPARERSPFLAGLPQAICLVSSSAVRGLGVAASLASTLNANFPVGRSPGLDSA